MFDIKAELGDAASFFSFVRMPFFGRQKVQNAAKLILSGFKKSSSDYMRSFLSSVARGYMKYERDPDSTPTVSFYKVVVPGARPELYLIFDSERRGFYWATM